MRTDITNSIFADGEKGLLEQAFQLRESQTEEQRAIMRVEIEVNWPALIAYIKQSASLFTVGNVAFHVRSGWRVAISVPLKNVAPERSAS